jgi:hypothetical protein
MTPEEAAATATLLRAPAAIGAAAFLLGAVAGEAVSWGRRAADLQGPAALRLIAVVLVCVPFLLAADRYRRRSMQAWMIAAAIVATLRGAYLCVSLYPLESPGVRLTTLAVEGAIAGMVWLAVFAVTRPIPDP